MVEIGLAEAARLTRKDPSTITRAVQKGRISCNVDSSGNRVFDPAELERVYGKLHLHEDAAPESMAAHHDLVRAHEREITLMREHAELLREQLEAAHHDRDQWRQQATYLLEDKSKKESLLDVQRTTEQKLRDDITYKSAENEQLRQRMQELQDFMERVRGSWIGRILLQAHSTR